MPTVVAAANVHLAIAQRIENRIIRLEPKRRGEVARRLGMQEQTPGATRLAHAQPGCQLAVNRAAEETQQSGETTIRRLTAGSPRQPRAESSRSATACCAVAIPGRTASNCSSYWCVPSLTTLPAVFGARPTTSAI